MTEEQARAAAKTLRLGAYGTRAIHVDGDTWGVATWTSAVGYTSIESMPSGWQRVLAEDVEAQ